MRDSDGTFRAIGMLPAWATGTKGIDAALRQQASIRQCVRCIHRWRSCEVILTTPGTDRALGIVDQLVSFPSTRERRSEHRTEKWNYRIKITDDPIFREFNFRNLVLDPLTDEDLLVILDLSQVQSLHSPGLANLVSIHVSLQKRGRKLEITGLSELNLRLLKTTNLDRLLVIR